MMQEASLLNNQSSFNMFYGVVEDMEQCFRLRLLGYVYSLIFFSSISLNSLLLYTFYRKKKLRSPVNIFIVTITLFNLTGTLIEPPFVIVSHFNCGWKFSHYECVLSAFVIYTVGCTSIYLMCAISFERLYVVYNRTLLIKLKKSFYLSSLIVCLLAGLFWTSMPLIGWSEYSLEDVQTSCSIRWNVRNLNVTSYNVTIFIFVFIIPLMFLIISNLKLLFIVKDSRNYIANFYPHHNMEKRIRAERRITIKTALMILIFCLSWSPYGLVSMYTALIDSNGVNKMAGSLAILFSKTSLFWTAATYLVVDMPCFLKRSKELSNVTLSGVQFTSNHRPQSVATSPRISTVVKHHTTTCNYEPVSTRHCVSNNELNSKFKLVGTVL